MTHEGILSTHSLRVIPDAELSNAQVVAMNIVQLENWYISLLERIDCLRQKGLSPIKIRVLEAIAAEEKFLAIQRLGIGENMLALSAAFRNGLACNNHHLDLHPAAELLPEVSSARNTSNMLIEADQSHWSLVHDLAQFYLSADEVGPMLLDTAHRSAAEKLKVPRAKDLVGIWEIVYSCISGREEYDFNQRTRELYDKIVQHPRLLKRPYPILLATLFCYHMGVLYGLPPRHDRIDTALHHARQSTLSFWNAINEEEFPNGYGNIFRMPDFLRG